MNNSFKESSVKENENNIYKEPLKMDSKSSVGGNLERSYSSPNLFQVSLPVVKKIPIQEKRDNFY